MVDLKSQYHKIKSEIDRAVLDCLESTAFINGQPVTDFQKNLENYLGVRHVIPCANGTDAIYVVMKALGLKSGDEVITTAHSWIATSETITQAGGRVVFCDTERNFFNINPAQIEVKITPKTRGIIPVHLCGQSADMDPILAIARGRPMALASSHPTSAMVNRSSVAAPDLRAH